MKLVLSGQALCFLGQAFGILSVVVGLGCFAFNYWRYRRDKDLYTDQLRTDNKRLRQIIGLDRDQMSHDKDLLDHARSRELELTEERNRLRQRNVLLSRILTEDDICSERKLTKVWKQDV